MEHACNVVAKCIRLLELFCRNPRRSPSSFADVLLSAAWIKFTSGRTQNHRSCLSGLSTPYKYRVTWLVSARYLHIENCLDTRSQTCTTIFSTFHVLDVFSQHNNRKWLHVLLVWSGCFSVFVYVLFLGTVTRMDRISRHYTWCRKCKFACRTLTISVVESTTRGRPQSVLNSECSPPGRSSRSFGSISMMTLLSLVQLHMTCYFDMRQIWTNA